MTSFTCDRSVVIRARPDVVYDYVSDFPRHVEWNHQPTEMESLTGGPVRVGSTYRTQEQLASTAPGVQKLLWPLLKRLMGVTGNTEAEITALEENRLVAWKAVLLLTDGGHGARSKWELRLQPHGEDTRVTQVVELEFLGKFAERMKADAAREATGLEMERNLSRLKKIVEAQTARVRTSSSPAVT